MLIQKFSKDSKRGIVVGANNVTPEKIAAGAITLASALVISAIGGLFGGNKKSKRAGNKKSKSKKKSGILALALPLVFNTAKSAIQKNALDGITAQFAQSAKEEQEVEMIDAIPISSEAEVYEHI